MNALPLVTKIQALALKELGFDWDCKNLYADGSHTLSSGKEAKVTGSFLRRPEVSLALKFMREKYDLHCSVRLYFLMTEQNTYNCNVYDVKNKKAYPVNNTPERALFDDYELAESEGLTKLIEIAQKQK